VKPRETESLNIPIGEKKLNGKTANFGNNLAKNDVISDELTKATSLNEKSTKLDRKLIYKLKLIEGLANKITENITKKSVVISMLQLTTPKQQEKQSSSCEGAQPEFTRLLLLGGVNK